MDSEGRAAIDMPFDRSYFIEQYRDYARQNPPRKLAFYRRLVERAAGDNPRPAILDIGCAFGLFLASLDGRWRRWGEDASEYAVQCAREASPSIRFGVSLEGGHPFGGPFDVITAWDVLEHIPDVEAELEWIRRSLVPGGAFAFVVPVYDGVTGPIIRALDRDPTHLHKRGRPHWLELAGRHFELVNWWGIYRLLLPGGPYVHVASRALRNHTPAIACLARCS